MTRRRTSYAQRWAQLAGVAGALAGAGLAITVAAHIVGALFTGRLP